MRVPAAFDHIHDILSERFPEMRAAQCVGLSLWVWGAILAQSACETAVVAVLVGLKKEQTARQALRDWLRNGSEKAAPCSTQVEVRIHFPWLMRWLVSLWTSPSLPLAIDATLHQDRVTALVVSVLFRGTAIPVAWCMMPALQKGPWMDPIIDLLKQLKPAVPDEMQVLVMADRGLWSRRLWTAIRANGWHPMLRAQSGIWFQPHGGKYQQARNLVPGEGYAWAGAGLAFTDSHGRMPATLTVVWDHGQDEPWILLTDLPPEEADPSYYALRMWIELGFKALKSMGWHWNETRRVNCERVERHWLVLAVVTLWTAAVGGLAEDLEQKNPQLNKNRTTRKRTMSVIRRGRGVIVNLIIYGQMPPPPKLTPEAWPTLSPGVNFLRHLRC